MTKRLVIILVTLVAIAIAISMAYVEIRKPVSPLSPLIVVSEHKFYLPSVSVNYDPPGYSSKKGLASACREPVAPGRSDWDALKVGAAWLYNWGTQPPIVAQNMESVPMIWGKFMMDWPIGGNSDYLMGFNEPDRTDQANLSPELAATLWYTIEMMYPDKLLVAPVPSQQNNNWLVQFRDSFNQQFGRYPRLDVLAAHCYDTFNYCRSHLQWYENVANVWYIDEVWLTEFNSVSRPMENMVQLVEWMENEELITRYAIFTNAAINTPECFPWTPLFDASGNLNQVGLWYKNVPN